MTTTRLDAMALGVGSLVLLGFAEGRATEPMYYEIAQPMFDEATGCVEIRHVTYQLWVGSGFPGREIGYTCAFGPVVVNPGRTIAREDVADHNIARALGISVSTETKDFDTWKRSSDPASPGTYVDTLAVELDVRLSERQMLRKSFRDSLLVAPGVLEQAVRATLACVLENAGRSEITIRRLRIRVVGSPPFRSFRVYFGFRPASSGSFARPPIE